MYVFKGGDKFPLGDVTGDCGLTSVEPCPSKKVSSTCRLLSLFIISYGSTLSCVI